MKTLLVLNDHGKPAAHAATFALNIAQKIRANIIVASLLIKDDLVHLEDIQLSATGAIALHRSKVVKTLFSLKKKLTDFLPVIQEIEISHFTGDALYKLAKDRNINLVIHGMDELLPSTLRDINDILLGKIKCPLLIVPIGSDCKAFRDLVYFTDLRFCGIKKVTFIADFAKEWNAKILIAHAAVRGLPEIDTDDANDIFKNEIRKYINYSRITMNMLNTEDIPDVIKLEANESHADLLIFVNQHFHFNTFTKQYFKDKCNSYKLVPMLIFPY